MQTVTAKLLFCFTKTISVTSLILLAYGSDNLIKRIYKKTRPEDIISSVLVKTRANRRPFSLSNIGAI